MKFLPTNRTATRKTSTKIMTSALVLFAATLFAGAAIASTLFTDVFNGSSELHTYDTDYVANDMFSSSMLVATDHVTVDGGAGDKAGYTYTGHQISDNQCASIDIKQDANLGTWNTSSDIFFATANGSITNAFDLRSGETWIFYDENLASHQADGTVLYDPYVWHTIKACLSGSTVIGYLDDNELFQSTAATTTPTYFGFAAEYPVLIDNFTIETYTATNQAPVVSAIAVTPNPVQTNTSVTGTATFTDAGTSHTATAHWADGTDTSCSVTEPSGSTPGSVSCTKSSGYTTANVYGVTVTVSDGSLSGDSPVTYVSVYEPTQSSVFSAGSRFSNPTSTANPNNAGSVRFGLTYRYQGSMPTGVRPFTLDFNAANIHFNATSVSSLVVSGSTATLTGSGTLNGTSGYNYLVVGVDNGGIRIKITNASTSAVVYDSQSGASDTATPTTSVTGQVQVQ